MSSGWTNFSVGNGSQAGDSDDVPACASCKKRKLRCSRETPTCSHCQRLGTECVYQPKQKPGLKPGAVEALTRRVAFLERILLDEAGNVRAQYNDPNQAGSDFSVDATDRPTQTPHHTEQHDQTTDQPYHLPQPVETSMGHADEREVVSKPINPLKRKTDYPFDANWPLDLVNIDPSQHLPGEPILSKVAEFFCSSFHHWIPYIHKQRLRTRVRDGLHSPGFDLVLHALLAVALRHMDPAPLFLDDDQIQQQIGISRLIVETQAVRIVTVESLQALIFIVFDHLNNGQPQKAWPLIGMLTRTIDYLQLTTEPSASHGSLMKPVRLVQTSHDWTELEERRRLFWIIFLLDRFCSITTGWNTSLTADDVHRRLPADGGYFTREEPVTTPYFGIWNKAAARIGRSLANVPAQYNEEDIEQLPGPGASPNSANGYIDSSKLGAFAYAVEAAESLSQVTTFFLQQKINWQDKEHAVNWLTRFKELDLRLVHWKIFLPPKWKDSNISADRSIVDMDPNLTLAHLTHNTSMIMLHHPIAFPPRGWNNYVALPQECSTQTCELAAVEASNIVDKFLKHTPIPFVNAQFAFCTFVAAKALLFDHQVTRKPLRAEFERLTRNLWDMSERWTKYRDGTERIIRPSQTQAGLYARQLEYLRDTCHQDQHFRFDLYDHSCGQPGAEQYASPISIATPQQSSHAFVHKRPSIAQHARQNSFHSSQSALSPIRRPSTTMTYAVQVASPAANGQHSSLQSGTALLSPRGSLPVSYGTSQGANSYNGSGQPMFELTPNGVQSSTSSIQQIPPINGSHNQSVQDQSLLTLSDTFMDSQFLGMDRVITFEDANFFMPWQ
ncbi:fungal-specific transcription factor domain-containing protein [Paraphoma chrysanthemicola]|uniref:Fungal-specific transcription factor domain-containing protein n=1 Tax=Paraphoma chrysanthemicola TaxID=798071 RepID=A0A8K0W2I8_9PLEO|nr:fungal-specific transcription factor domain-containing protein [Paraphoma chrysanthemicola]